MAGSRGPGNAPPRGAAPPRWAGGPPATEKPCRPAAQACSQARRGHERLGSTARPAALVAAPRSRYAAGRSWPRAPRVHCPPSPYRCRPSFTVRSRQIVATSASCPLSTWPLSLPPPVPRCADRRSWPRAPRVHCPSGRSRCRRPFHGAQTADRGRERLVSTARPAAIVAAVRSRVRSRQIVAASRWWPLRPRPLPLRSSAEGVRPGAHAPG